MRFRRRLPVVMVRLKMAQTITEADTLVRHVHVGQSGYCIGSCSCGYRPC